MKKVLLIALTLLYAGFFFQSRAQAIDEVKFFEEDTIINAKLKMDISGFIKSASKPASMPAIAPAMVGL